MVNLIEAGARWRYLKGTQEPPADWKAIDFNDSEWLEGETPLGYGEDKITLRTILTDMRNAYATVYLRKEFTTPGADRISTDRTTRPRLSINYDDGIVAYLNGQELFRRFMRAGAVNSRTLAQDHECCARGMPGDPDPDEVRPLTEAQTQLMVAGKNVLAIEIHNTQLNSSDLVIEAQLQAWVLPEPGPEFVRGTECDGSPSLDLGDPIYILRWRFGAFYPEPGCVKACDTNDDGSVDLSDAVYALNFIFQGGPAFNPPYPEKGTDLTPDDLTCVSGEPPQ